MSDKSNAPSLTTIEIEEGLRKMGRIVQVAELKGWCVKDMGDSLHSVMTYYMLHDRSSPHLPAHWAGCQRASATSGKILNYYYPTIMASSVNGPCYWSRTILKISNSSLLKGNTIFIKQKKWVSKLWKAKLLVIFLVFFSIGKMKLALNQFTVVE